MRRSSRIYTSLNRDQTVMGVEKRAFMIVAFLGAAMFANKVYLGLTLVPVIHLFLQWMTKKDYRFFDIFMRFMSEDDVYSSLPQVQSIHTRPQGWGRGLPC